MSMHFWLAWIASFFLVAGGLFVAVWIHEYFLYRRGK
jgi:hypothetical protein